MWSTWTFIAVDQQQLEVKTSVVCDHLIAIQQGQNIKMNPGRKWGTPFTDVAIRKSIKVTLGVGHVNTSTHPHHEGTGEYSPKTASEGSYRSLCSQMEHESHEDIKSLYNIVMTVPLTQEYQMVWEMHINTVVKHGATTRKTYTLAGR